MQAIDQMQPYKDLLQEILRNGHVQHNKRTGSECKVVVGTQMKFDLSLGFPALTLRKIPIKSIIAELLGFFRGYTSAKQFRDLGCTFWDQNANETKAWLDNPLRKGEDDLGVIYGSNWTNWVSRQVVKSDWLGDPEHHLKMEYLRSQGWEIGVSHEGGTLVTKRINQLEDVVRRIMTDPSDRRILLTGWNPGVTEMQSIPACHLSYKFVPFEGPRVMHLVMDMRSMDFYLGTPANIASAALLLSIVCRLTGYHVGTVTIQGANTHLYENSYKAAEQLLKRSHYKPPFLYLGRDIKRLESLDEVRGCFERIEPTDIELVNYIYHPAIPVEMMA